MKAVQLALSSLEDKIIEEGLFLSNNTTVAAYLKKQKATISRDLYKVAKDIIAWSELDMVSISARYITGKINILVD